jgi:hypothetical protein
MNSNDPQILEIDLPFLWKRTAIVIRRSFCDIGVAVSHLHGIYSVTRKQTLGHEYHPYLSAGMVRAGSG